MIVGIGVDVCGIERLQATLERTPGLRDRVFAPAEKELPIASLAARFAMKEAVAKALLTPGDMSWLDAWAPRAVGKPPELQISGTVRQRAEALGVTRFHVSLSHDAGIATAFVIAES
ncbi:holo-ACP synthase [Dermatophilus congolensis]|uniref:Holo-[acyl-carrier-protein] synthase n=1 Tax=Dermatophilus congolensis TaxID=1863 RepID=A0AA46BNV1_9MICO|nr:holo-ACP synthase [Dermatophilus congolensis]MBO3143257.1 holo-ACP synthase [Dermatophilus congolensis]MBO3152244.1 holo-ACP synthase [Dermatophilus congolensis]MBO3160744.1 holo-ACP synthase [Dermatophilus congolensis]MBO3163532.1 holo-ACP synthase [Dermatophilus congolensis]MBO3177078.1 holo-ACP synthase [Dermatophilus congolensis]